MCALNEVKGMKLKMRIEILEKTNEVLDLLDSFELENRDELEEMLLSFKEKLKEEFYQEFLTRYQELIDSDFTVEEAIDTLEAMFEDYEEVLEEDFMLSFEDIIDDLKYLDEGDVNAAKEMLESFLESLS